MSRILTLFAGALLAFPLHAQNWKPTKPITIIVPWAAGGATDQVTRLAAAELEPALGQKIVVVNQPGGSGSIGTRNAMEAPKDGYTWTAGAAKQLGTYPLLGMLNSKVDDFHLYLSVTNVSIVSVNPGTPYQSLQQLLDDMKARPGQVKVATAGNTSSGHFAMEAIAKAAGVKYRHVTYDGGNPAVVATVAGETELTTQLAVEQAEMIKGKRLRPLAVVADQPLTIEGVGTIAPITQTLRGFPKVTTAFGIFIPKGVPAEVAATMDRVWAERVAKSEKIRQYAQSRGALFTPAVGKAAYDVVWPTVVEDAYMLQEAGMVKVSPESIGIRR
jgi:tripartite-type tricarboxylate transporter receptor subunit TctC